MRTAQIDGNSTVANIIDAPEGFEFPGFTLIASETAKCGDIYDELGGGFSAPTIPVAARRQAVCDEIDALRDALLARGCPYGDKRIQVDAESRADLDGMVTAAHLALNSVIAWPADMSQGWIALDNTRIALPTPADGITLGATVGSWYAAARQNSRTLKDSALASDNPEGVDITTGWPAG